MKYNTIKEAAQAWVNEFNAIPYGVVEKLVKVSDYTDINEITPPSKYDRVYVFNVSEWGDITEYNEENDTYIIELDNGDKMELEEDNFEVEKDGYLPMWGTLWAFSDSCDNWWIGENLQTMADCGFRIYESEDYEYIFGIDGAGYDFYESHWIPLYKARGLQWHYEGGEN